MDGTRFDTLAKSLAAGRSRRSVLKGLIGGGAALVAAKAGPVLAQLEDNVLICHFTASETNPYELITVSPAAVDAHLEHGDFNPVCKEEPCKCPIKCPDSCERDNQCCDGYVCNFDFSKEGAAGICQREECKNPDTCNNDNQCCDGQVCLIPKEGAAGICQLEECKNPDTCNNDNQCCPGLVCTSKGICGLEECFNPKTCNTDHDCCPGMLCLEASGEKVCTPVK